MSQARTTLLKTVQAISYRWIAIIVLLCSFPFSLFLPQWVAWENELLENAQAVVLLLGALIALIYALNTDGKSRIFWISVIPIWLIMVARELSWGAVFFEPSAMTSVGPMFSSSLLWYHSYRTPVVLLIIAAIAIGFAHSKAVPIVYNMARKRQIPFFDLFGFIIAMLFSTAAEHHMGLSMDWWPGHDLITEETMELAAYIFLLSAQRYVWQVFPDNQQIARL